MGKFLEETYVVYVYFRTEIDRTEIGRVNDVDFVDVADITGVNIDIDDVDCADDVDIGVITMMLVRATVFRIKETLAPLKYKSTHQRWESSLRKHMSCDISYNLYHLKSITDIVYDTLNLI